MNQRTPVLEAIPCYRLALRFAEPEKTDILVAVMCGMQGETDSILAYRLANMTVDIQQ